MAIKPKKVVAKDKIAKDKIAKDKVAKDPLKCARQIMNFSSIKQTDRFDKPRFDPDEFLSNLAITSPKMIAMLENIKELDRKDYKNEKKLYKHYIYSSIGNGYGSKIIVSALDAAGYTILNKAKKSKIVLDEDLLSNTLDTAKVAVLSSTALFNISTTPATTKSILSVYNKRPENVHGELVRFIVLDSGFKEGVDLFDVKYVHIFEDQLTDSDLTQSLGRALRYCGQKELQFKKNGWKVQVYNYSLYKVNPRDIRNYKFFETKETILEYLKKQNKDISCKVNFENSITDIIQKNSVDYTLNKNVNNYKPYKFEISRNIVVGTGLATTALGAAAYLYKKK
jgi:hypothetical protein